MSSHRCEAARLEAGMTEGRIASSTLQLVTVCLCDDATGEVSEARALAFCLLELAEHAERRSDSLG